ncbi:MAG: hypothetical protein KatS3mg050_2438 [Litorilinea sp.]|nr:MAG: hypothetical protein KatS3mg050_2438 [Litorilinea sp.]
MSQTYALHEIARLPLPGDNVAVATQRLEAGTRIQDGERTLVLPHTVLEGHRFAVQPIEPGQPLLSWQLPFGIATRPIQPGDYICNESILEALRVRDVDVHLPDVGNFQDRIVPFELDEATFQPAPQVPPYPETRTFLGYRRGPGRGVGTRNYIVLLGTSSRTGSFVKQLEARVKHLAVDYPNIDGIVAVAHTEGGTAPDGRAPNNLELLLRTLAGFMVHPNVGAVLAVDFGVEPVTNERLRHFMEAHGYPLDQVPHHFLSLTGSFQENLARGEAIVAGWLEEVNAARRTPESLAHLKIALQCGGSDAFSGISGNPLASWVAREVIRYGGAANLAETDELIGAEPYVLQKVRDLETARRFLATVERFQARAARHGHSAEGNPSGGNKFRGLYNIVLKSIGAAMKKHPDVRLDGVLEYGEPMPGPGFYFMDSPGNDLESIAGQVASGCNLIFFITGNGSITNFPFVPTIKIVTTTRRYQLLSREMDVNAGAYLDGTPMDELGAQTLELTVEVASGRRTVGELAGHAQVQIWRDWRLDEGSRLEEVLQRQPPVQAGQSLPIRPLAPRPADASVSSIRFTTYRHHGVQAIDQVGLILPTSLCAGQVAQMAAQRLNRRGLGREHHLSRFVALAHTEGCGNSGGTSEELYVRTMLGYLTHPMVRHCLLLEHGCEKTHNDYMRHQMERMGLDPAQVGWASIQLDGGIERVLAKVEAWFAQAIQQAGAPTVGEAGLESLRLGLASMGPVPEAVAQQLARLTRLVVHAGGSVVVPQNAGLLSHLAYLEETLGDHPPVPTLFYGQPMAVPGFHIMETPTEHWVETLTGLGATGVEIMVAYVGEHPVQTHPLVPVLQVTADPAVATRFQEDLDLVLAGDSSSAMDGWPGAILTQVAAVAAGRYAPRLYRLGNVDFQLTRGLLGISL